MLATTGNGFPGREVVESRGIVSGASVLAFHIGQDLMASLKSMVGGKITEYERLLERSRDRALSQMEQNARRRGANAIVGVRHATSMIAPGLAEVLAYGTAVVVDPPEEEPPPEDESDPAPAAAPEDPAPEEPEEDDDEGEAVPE